MDNPNKHVANSHKDKSHVCNSCDKIFASKKYLRAHVANVHKNESCDTNVARKRTLKLHMTSVHDIERPKCTKCARDFSTIGQLCQHIAMVHNGKSHICTKCGKVFTTKVGLEYHIASFHNKESHICAKCGQVFTSKVGLEYHIASFHNKKRLKCTKCAKEYSTKKQLNGHIAVVHNKKGHVCTTCGKIFIYRGKLQEHIDYVHHNEGHKCTTCGKIYQTKNLLQKHVTCAHEVKNHKCTICDRIYSYYGLKNHMKKIHPGKRIKFTCHHCHITLFNKKTINHHIRIKHNQEQYCSQCNEYFISLKELNTHKTIHLPEVPKCHLCNSVFVRKTSLMRHMAFHFPAERIQCELCSKIFRRKDSCRVHMVNYHGVGGEDYECDVCKKYFNSWRAIELHMGSHFRRFKCRICNKLFSQNSHLTHHLKEVHRSGPSLKRKYHCNDCTAFSTDRSYMPVHWLTYHNPSHKFKCALCNFRYSTAEGLAEHYQCKGRKYSCTICQRKCATKKQLYRHRKESHKTLQLHDGKNSKRSTSLPIDARSVKTKRLVVEVKKKVDDGIPPLLTCEHCRRQFYSIDVLTSHKRQHRVFNSFVDLRSVKRSVPLPFDAGSEKIEELNVGEGNPEVDGDITALVTCEQCHQRFYSMNVLTSHKRQHRVFNSFVDLRGVKRSASFTFDAGSVEIEELRINEVMKELIEEYRINEVMKELIEELRINEGMRELDDGSPTLLCEHCHQRFYSMDVLTSHKKQHRVFNSFVALVDVESTLLFAATSVKIEEELIVGDVKQEVDDEIAPPR